MSLLEVVIAIAVLGVLVAGFVPALMQSTRSMIGVDDRETAKNLAESQMEFIKGQPYQATYHPSANYSAEYPGFVVDDPIVTDQTISNRDQDIQAVTVIVKRGSTEVIRLTGYKVK